MNDFASRQIWRTAFLGAAMFALVASTAYAQDTKAPVPHNQTISANPFGLMAGWFNAEYERKLTASTTIGVSGSKFSMGGADLQRGNVLVRYYPQGAALTGVYLGGRTGFTRVAARLDEEELSAHAFAAGFEIGYSWLLGSKRNVGISLGAGMDRLFGGDLDDFSINWPNIRLVNVGIAF